MTENVEILKPKKARNMAISAIRCVAMTGIILCHFFQYYGIELAWWFNVGVHMFLFMSGFLYGHKDISSPIDFIIKNFKKILVPYYCFLLPAIVMYFIFARSFISWNSVVFALLCNGTITGMEHLWFISYILFCYILTPYLSDLVKKLRGFSCYSFLAICFGLIVLGFVWTRAFQSFFGYNCIICYLLGYFASVFLHQYGENKFRVLSYVVIFVAIVANGVRIYYKYVLHTGFIGFGYFEMYAHVCLGAALVLGLFQMFSNVKENAVLSMVDKYSYYIYIVHQVFILGPFTLLLATEYAPINWILTLIVIIISAVVLKLFSDKVSDILDK